MRIGKEVRELQYQRTVPRRLVHRAAVNEVFLTDSCAIGINRYAVAAQLPRGHELYSDRPTREHDPMLVAEVCRQASILIAHEYMGVPDDWMFISRKLVMKSLRRELFAVGERPTDVVVEIEVDHSAKTRGLPAGASMTYAVTIRGEVASTGAASVIYLSRESYDKLRAEGMAKKSLLEHDAGTDFDPVAPGDIDRSNRKNVVIGREDPRGYPICVARDHPSLFDHELDHLSGAVLLEACRQAALLHLSEMAPGFLGGPLDYSAVEFCSLEAMFTDFAELDSAVHCRVLHSSIGPERPAGGREIDVEVAIVQQDLRVSDMRIVFLLT
ncbi:ScbA/BarX family gamma-butyrolactone biosynthesis protein [Nocardia sp. SYP-A9097]|uniref:ScbA/BarX family gamma-butyrolactone biosynthesis protein n=1 Tax=Nocardia sp. SYP-A9097 TaxID=2663237 RepID=UPI001E59C0AF|nr:ScbA/BarX family gamma-butyrolactone biosynthesis protein [Nocardia sp. SYP-A9097]